MIRAVVSQQPTTEERISYEITDDNAEVVEKTVDRFMAQCDRIRIDFNEKIFLIHEKKLREINDRIETEGEKLRSLLAKVEDARAQLQPLQAKLDRKKESRLQTA